MTEEKKILEFRRRLLITPLKRYWIAEELGVAESTINRWKRGIYTPTEEVIDRVLTLLDKEEQC